MQKRVLISVAMGVLGAPLAVQAAGSFMIGNDNIEFNGGITGSYIYQSDPGSKKQDTVQVTDFILQLEREAQPRGIGFTAGVGQLLPPYIGQRDIIIDNGSQKSRSLGPGVAGLPTELFYGWVRVMPIEHVAIDVGRLESHMGYETDLTYQNSNIMLGLVRGNQPVFYDGARFTLEAGGLSIYVEADKDVEPILEVSDTDHTLVRPGFEGTIGSASNGATANAIGAGVKGRIGDVMAELNLFSAENHSRVIDLVAETTLMGIDVAANVDYIMESDSLKNAIKRLTNQTFDDSAFGAAVYATFPVVGSFTVPVRVEFVDDGNSGIYGLGNPAYFGTDVPVNSLSNTGVSITVTPTYNFSKHMFVRAELAYVAIGKAKDKQLAAFKDPSGNPTNSNTIFVLQVGTRF